MGNPFTVANPREADAKPMQILGKGCDFFFVSNENQRRKRERLDFR